MGLSCPTHWTLTRFLDLLVRERVLPEVATREYLALYDEARYGVAVVDAGRAQAVVGAVLAELERVSPAEVARVVTALAPPPATPVPDASGARDAENGSRRAEPGPQQDAVGPPEGEIALGGPERPGRGSPRRRRLTLLGVAVLWSAVMLGLGVVGKPFLALVWNELRVGVLGAPQLVSPEERLGVARDRAAGQPGAVEAWLTYANRAEDLGRSSEAALALRHLVARFPDDPELLNHLAWLYCAAADPVARDPVQALDLAERAHALSQEPHITDTLAEAVFQNGDLLRAVTLEEEALRRAGDNPEFYRQQLARFRAAAEGR